MHAWKKSAVRFSVAALALLGTAMLALTWWLPTDKELALRLTAFANQRFGLDVVIDSVDWALLPTPSITVLNLRTQQEQPVAIAMGTFNRRSPIAGKGTGQTVVSASGESIVELLRSLHTQTQFPVNPATVLRFDLDKAISTGGKEHGGQTNLQVLTGQLDTQNGAEGMRMTVSDIRARTGKFTATGKATVYRRQIEASGNLDLVEGAVGVPFARAAIGTVLLPGIGTVVGARVGGAIGRILKGDDQTKMLQNR